MRSDGIADNRVLLVFQCQLHAHNGVGLFKFFGPYFTDIMQQAGDAISGARPGARREVIEQYTRRLKELEQVGLSFEGVDKCFAIQAGRELRVIVDAEKASDERAGQLSFEISQKIERDMQYPGQIKVTVIREMRAVTYAK